MEFAPVLKMKLVITEVSGGVLHTDRLKKLNMARHRVVIITAPAGFGKTTAVLLSLRKNRDAVHWYRLEREDAFLPVFYSHLIETLFGGLLIFRTQPRHVFRCGL